MVRNTGVSGVWVMVFACLAGAFVLATQVMVHAQPGIVEVEGVGYNVNASMADNLKALIGKKVSITLDSGKTLTGTVKAVGGQLLHLEKLEGKEFFDALVRLEDISAVYTRFRGERR